jgi:hypothetical protein
MYTNCFSLCEEKHSKCSDADATVDCQSCATACATTFDGAMLMCVQAQDSTTIGTFGANLDACMNLAGDTMDDCRSSCSPLYVRFRIVTEIHHPYYQCIFNPILLLFFDSSCSCISTRDKNFLGWTPETEDGTDSTGDVTDVLTLRAKYQRLKSANTPHKQSNSAASGLSKKSTPAAKTLSSKNPRV